MKLTGMSLVIREYWKYFVVIDAISMAIIYKCYYGRSIVNEVTAEDNEVWDYDKKTHQYHKKKKSTEPVVVQMKELPREEIEEMSEVPDEIFEESIKEDSVKTDSDKEEQVGEEVVDETLDKTLD